VPVFYAAVMQQHRCRRIIISRSCALPWQLC